jgi:hypothetical protein
MDRTDGVSRTDGTARPDASGRVDVADGASGAVGGVDMGVSCGSSRAALAILRRVRTGSAGTQDEHDQRHSGRGRGTARE